MLRESDGNMDDAAEKLLNSTEGGTGVDANEPGPSSHIKFHSSSDDLSFTPHTVAELLGNHITKMVDTTRTCKIEVNRDKVWRHGLGFYKNSLHNTACLTREFHVEFVGEGVDGGALKNDFFEQLLKEVNEKLFEGDMCRRVPRRDWSLEHNMEIAGIIIAHSIIQGGPAFPCLCPPVYLVYGDLEKALEVLPTKDDIPRNMATAGTWSFIEQVHVCPIAIFFLCVCVCV